MGKCQFAAREHCGNPTFISKLDVDGPVDGPDVAIPSNPKLCVDSFISPTAGRNRDILLRKALRVDPKVRPGGLAWIGESSHVASTHLVLFDLLVFQFCPISRGAKRYSRFLFPGLLGRYCQIPNMREQNPRSKTQQRGSLRKHVGRFWTRKFLRKLLICMLQSLPMVLLKCFHVRASLCRCLPVLPSATSHGLSFCPVFPSSTAQKRCEPGQNRAQVLLHQPETHANEGP